MTTSCPSNMYPLKQLLLLLTPLHDPFGALPLRSSSMSGLLVPTMVYGLKISQVICALLYATLMEKHEMGYYWIMVIRGCLSTWFDLM